MGGSTTTTVTPAAPTQAETDYINSQQALANQQLQILGSQQNFNQDYMNEIKPILDQQTQLLSQQLAAQSNPDQLALTSATTKAQLQQLQDNADLEPLQKQVLTAQLQQSLQGPNATPAQAAQIDAATSAAQSTGAQQIDQFSTDALQQLRENLSPSLGLRPTDTPITDRGQQVEKAAVNQYGQLTSNLAEANANAKLNYPLAAGQLQQAQSGFASDLSNAASSFQASLSDAAATNRLRLLSSASDLINGGTQTGIGLASASRSNPLSFAQGSTSTASKSPGLIDYLGAAGNVLQGLGAIGVSDVRVKTNIHTEGYDKAGRRWVRFEYKGDPSKTQHIGVIAQEVEKTDPEAVLTDGNGLKMVNYKRLAQKAA